MHTKISLKKKKTVVTSVSEPITGHPVIQSVVTTALFVTMCPLKPCGCGSTQQAYFHLSMDG